MKMLILCLAMSVTAFYGGCIYGKSMAKTEIIEKQVEVIKYVAQKRAKIQAQPDANRDELLELLRTDKL